MHLIESAPFNLGRKKLYNGVAGNLVAFACKKSFESGFEGNVSFVPKTKMKDHYSKTLGAIFIGNQRMIIESRAALFLINKYFSDEEKNKRA